MGKLSKAFEKAFSEDMSGGLPGGALQQSKEDRHVTQDSEGGEPSPKTAVQGSAAFLASGNWDERLRIATDPCAQYLEHFKRLRASILHPPSGIPARTILVTSVAPNEGKGFVCANLGVALSQGVEYHALLVDCDLRRPTLAPLFGLSNDTGIVDHLRNDVDLSLLVRKTGQEKLSLIPSGKPPRNPAELLDSLKMKDLIAEVAERYRDRIVIFDSPPNIVASETSILAKQVDGVIVVVRSGYSRREHVKKLIDSIGPEKVLGVVFNAHKENKVKTLISEKVGYDYSAYYG